MVTSAQVRKFCASGLVPSSDVARRSCAALHPVIYTRRGREALALTFSLALQSGTDGLVSLVRTVVIVCSARRPA